MNQNEEAATVTTPEAVLEPLFVGLTENINGLEGDDSVISTVQQSIIECINTARHTIGKAPLDLGALDTVHLLIGNGNSVFEAEFGSEVGTLETIDAGPSQRFTITNSEALRTSILAKIQK
ncbi:MAG: hypothetical protein RLY57_697 [Candidatus Parcubacteria bacterium]|jgi:hypothetical protein